MKCLYLHCLLFLLPSIMPAQTDEQIAGIERQVDRHWGTLAISFSPNWSRGVTSDEAAQLEVKLAADPEDAHTRIRLINYYLHQHLAAQRTASIFWLITHHPESPILGWDICRLVPEKPHVTVTALTSPDIPAIVANYVEGDYAAAAKLWDAALAHDPVPPEAIHNAARFFMISDPEKTARLVARLEETDGIGHSKLIADYRTNYAPMFARH